MSRPLKTDFPPFFTGYIDRVQANDLAEATQKYAPSLMAFYMGLPEEKADYCYAPGKWSVKDLLQHVIDTERIMSYRLLRVSRNDQTPLASFDENNYANNAQASSRSLASLKEEFAALRKSTDLLIASLSESQMAHDGISGNHRITANALGYIIFGHMLHHKMVLEEKYL